MNNNLREIAQLIDSASELKQGSVSTYRQFRDDYVKGIDRIDKAVGTSGDAAKMKEVWKGQNRRKLFQTLNANQQDFTNKALKAKLLAEDMVSQKITAPAKNLADKFEASMANLKTRLLLAPNAQSGKEILSSFLQGTTDAWEASRIRDEFNVLVAPIIQSAGSQAAHFKVELASVYDQVSQKSLTDTQREAAELVEIADSMVNSTMYGLAIVDSVSELFGPREATMVNQMDQYFKLYGRDAEIPVGTLTNAEKALDKALHRFDDIGWVGV